jgi:hypothetical protein
MFLEVEQVVQDYTRNQWAEMGQESFLNPAHLFFKLPRFGFSYMVNDNLAHKRHP